MLVRYKNFEVQSDEEALEQIIKDVTEYEAFCELSQPVAVDKGYSCQVRCNAVTFTNSSGIVGQQKATSAIVCFCFTVAVAASPKREPMRTQLLRTATFQELGRVGRGVTKAPVRDIPCV